MSRYYLGNLSQSLKDQTTGKEQNRYHLEEIGIAGESTILLKLGGSNDCANTFERYQDFRLRPVQNVGIMSLIKMGTTQDRTLFPPTVHRPQALPR